MTAPKYGQDLSTIPLLRDAMVEHTESYSAWGTDYSVTTLIQPPRIVQLERRHKDYFEQLPIDHDFIEKNLASFRGTAIHNHFERMLYRYINKHKDAGYLIERRCWDRINGRKISGKFDCYLNGTLYDVKTTSVMKKIYGDYDSYIKQLNMYAWMLGEMGVPVDSLAILAWYRDWDKRRIYESGYPQTEVELIKINELWSPEQQKDFLYERIDLHKENENLPDDQLLPCSPEERWVREDKWAVYEVHEDWSEELQVLPARASRVLPTADEASDWMHTHSPKKPEHIWYLQHRPGTAVRCADYCKVNLFCNHWRAENKGVL